MCVVFIKRFGQQMMMFFFKFLVFANFVLNDILLLVRKIDLEFLNLENVAFILVLIIKQIPNPIVV